MFVMRRIVPVLIFLALAAPASAAHYASLRSDKVYLREGPTYQHRVLFIYKRKDYPVEVIASYESWRRVRDVDGTVGWISQMMLSEARTVLITGKGHAAIRSQPYPTASLRAWADPGVVARLKACKPQFCEIVADGMRGWIEKNRIWGVDTGEIID
jgi:SH3-like domain-containing protein